MTASAVIGRIKLGDRGDSLSGFAFQVRSLIWVDNVLFRGFIHSGRELRASEGSGGFVAGSDCSKSLFAESLDASFFSAVALSADDSLACAFDGRFMVCHIFI